MELKIFIKQAVQYNLQYQGGYYAGNTPQQLQFTVGTLPAYRQWASYGTYQEVTHDVTGLDKLKLTWTAERDENGNLIPGTIFSKKSASTSLLFYGQTFNLLKQWLIDDVSAPLNSVDVKIQHWESGKLCGTYEDYAIKAADLQYCDTITLCEFSVTLKQKDEILTCIKRTLITDNWQGWFPETSTTPANGKKHPRFSYCNEQRPNGMMVAIWWNLATLGFLTNTLLFSLIPIINLIVAIIALIKVIINAIIAVINALGGNVNPIQNTPQWVSPNSLLENWQEQFIETAGCQREMPAVLIRDYITNVCDKCGVKVTEETAPVFFARSIQIQTSDTQRGNGGVVTAKNWHYYATYFYPLARRGIRRFNTVQIFGGAKANTTDWWIPENAPLLTLDMFLDQIKEIYNAEWRVASKKVNGVDVPHLYFQRRDFFLEQKAIYDFTKNSPDRDKMVYGVCSEFNDKKYPASLRGLYSSDPQETCGNEGKAQANGLVVFGTTVNNPNYEGLEDKYKQFGAAHFRLDGNSNDYIYDACQVIVNGSLLTPFLAGIMRDIVMPAFETYSDYCLLLKHDLVTYPKIIIWNGQSYDNAKAIKLYSAVPGNLFPVPDINIPYNNYPISIPWEFKHPPLTFTIGSSMQFGSYPYGYYTVRGYLGVLIAQKPAMLINYPMYFAPDFKDSLWDWYHWIDDPNKHPVMNQTHTVKIKLCCDDIQYLGLFGALNNAKLAQTVKVPSNFYPDARITEITVSYDPTDEYGMWIELKMQV